MSSATFLKMPKFGNHERVRFIEGEGVVRKLHHQLEGWDYLVEMEMGREADFGRIGTETIIVLNETDLFRV